MIENKNIKKLKSPSQLERHLKGLANHYRIEILLLIDQSDGITLEKIIETLGANEKTIGEHVRRLFVAGLINKKHKGRFVEHTLSPYGKIFVDFLKAFREVN